MSSVFAVALLANVLPGLVSSSLGMLALTIIGCGLVCRLVTSLRK